MDGRYRDRRTTINSDEIGVSALIIRSGLRVGHWMTWFRLKSDSAFALFHILVSLYRIMHSIIIHDGRWLSVMLSVLFGGIVCVGVNGWIGFLNLVRIVAVS